MVKKMLIDTTHEEETRVVVVDGNKLEDVEFESSCRKQIKGNIYLGKVMRVEPSLQACFVDYGGNKHGFLAFGEIHPDYYNISPEIVAEVDKEVDEIIENKKRLIKEREFDRERMREERAFSQAQREGRLEMERTCGIAEATASNVENVPNEQTVTCEQSEQVKVIEQTMLPLSSESTTENAPVLQEENKKNYRRPRRMFKRRPKKSASAEQEQLQENKQDLTVMSEDAGFSEDVIKEDVSHISSTEEDVVDNEEDEEDELNFELQKKLLKVRKLFYRSTIQDVIKEGQILLVQVVKEERGNKGAALTTYLSLAGRYCVLMPNRIKSGGVSRKIVNIADRKRLRNIIKALPLGLDMSIIVRTAGEDKTAAEITRDYNYLIRAWNNIRTDSLKNQAPFLVYEEGNLIKRALRDIYNNEISEILVAGDEGFKSAKEFLKMLSPHSLKKIKPYKDNDIPLFQRYQVETQLDKLHDVNAELSSGGYIVINPTEALVAIDVNSGRATREKALEETALKTNLEACDEIAKQLRMRNLAGLVVIDFIDMDEPQNNHAVEKRMKEALKYDRSRVQVGKMSQFGLIELSRQRMHSSFFESNYQVCPHCQGKGIIRSVESSAIMLLRAIEEECLKNRASQIILRVPENVAPYLLNHKREDIVHLEQKYKMIISVFPDSSILNIADYKIEKTKLVPVTVVEETKPAEIAPQTVEEKPTEEKFEQTQQFDRRYNRRGRQNRRFHGRNNYRDNNNRRPNINNTPKKEEPVILYDSYEPETQKAESAEKGCSWWKRLIK